MLKLRIELIFTTVAVLSLASIAMVMIEGLIYVPLVVVTFGLNVWAVTQSEQRGFIKLSRMPRSGDPPTHFHPVQTMILVIFMFLQVCLPSYYILTL